jgi:hypothetical protein
MVRTAPEPEADNVPGKPLVAPVRAVHPVLEIVWVVLTDPADPPVQPVNVKVIVGLVEVAADGVKAMASD